MSLKHSLKMIALAGTCLVPLAAAAQGTGDFDVGEAPAAKAPPPVFNNQIDVGAAWQSQGSAKFGQYTGARDSGGYFLGGIQLRNGDAWDSGGTQYWDLRAYDLGYASRSVDIRFGQQGWWGGRLFYDGIPWNYYSNNFVSAFNRDGTLASGIARGSVRDVRTLSSFLNTFKAQTQRDTVGGEGSYRLNQEWVVSAGLKHEHKEGVKENSTLFGSSPVSPTLTVPGAAVGLGGALFFFPEPIDYDTDRYDVKLAYTTPRLQAEFSYTFSNFTDNLLSYNFQNPFLLSTAFTPTVSTANSAAITGFYSLPPSNSAHQFKAFAGYNLSPNTRITGAFGLGFQMQDAPFVPATGNPFLAAPVEVPRSSLDGLVRTTFGNVTLTSSPFPRFDILAKYTIDNRDNRTPRDTYVTPVGDTRGLPFNEATNPPYSYEHQTAQIEGGYKVLPGVKATIGYQFEQINRTFLDTEQTREHTAFGKVRATLFGQTSGTLSYAHSERTAVNLNPNRAFQALGEGVDVDSPRLVKFFLAPRTRDEVKLLMSSNIGPALDASLMLRFQNDSYGDNEIVGGFTSGLRNNYNITVGPNLTYTPIPGVTTNLFYNFQQIYYNQNGLFFSNTTPAATDTCNRGGVLIIPGVCDGTWNAKQTDVVHTLGLTGEWEAIADVLKVGANYNLAYGDASYIVTDGGATALRQFGGGPPTFGAVGNNSLVVAPLPNVHSFLSSVGVHAEYKFLPNVSLWMGYQFERFFLRDYAYDVGATQFVNVISSGEQKPSYSVHVLGAAMRFKF